MYDVEGYIIKNDTSIQPERGCGLYIPKWIIHI